MKKYQNLRSLLHGMLLSFFCLNAFGSHIVGADLYYQHVSGNTYQIYVALYGDCGSTTGAYPTLTIATPQVCIYDGSTMVTSIYLAMPSPVCGTEITPLCPDDTSQCTSLTFATPGIKKFLYTGTYTLPHTSSTWRFIYTGNNGSTSASWSCPAVIGSGSGSPSSSGRSAAITNLATAGSTTIQLIDTLNNSFADNSSPDLTVSQQTFFCEGQHDEYYPAPVDPESDSLVFSLVNATNGYNACGTVGGAVSYTGTAWTGTPISPTEPLTVLADSFVLNPATGGLVFHPNGFQRGVVVYNIREYRGGVLIGTSQREMTVLVVDCAVIFHCMFLPRHGLSVTGTAIENKVVLSPNPATNELTIKADQDYNSYTITNTLGDVLMQQPMNNSRATVNIKSLPAGLYIVTLKGEQGISVQKFVKM